MARKFYRQEFIVVVLCQEEALGSDTELMDIGTLADQGRIHADMKLKRMTILSSKEMAENLVKFGNEPSFFDLDKDGKDVPVRGL